jgi:hypothetical protein
MEVNNVLTDFLFSQNTPQTGIWIKQHEASISHAALPPSAGARVGSSISETSFVDPWGGISPSTRLS